MNFSEILQTLPPVEHLSGLELQDAGGQTVHHIPAVAGKLGSLRIYHALALRFDGVLTEAAVAQGLQWFAEHVETARREPGSHPNIDLLLRPGVGRLGWRLHPQPR